MDTHTTVMDGATLIMATDGAIHTTVMDGAILIIHTILITATDGDTPITETILTTQALEDQIMLMAPMEDIPTPTADTLKTTLITAPITITEEAQPMAQQQTALHLPEEIIRSLKTTLPITTLPITILPEQEAAATAILTDLLPTVQEVKATLPAHHDHTTIQDHQAITAADPEEGLTEEVPMAVVEVHTAAVADDLLAAAGEGNHTHYF